MMDYLKSINIEAIVEDPLLMLGLFLLAVGPLFFFIGLWKFIRFKNETQFIIPEHSSDVEQIEKPVEEVQEKMAAKPQDSAVLAHDKPESIQPPSATIEPTKKETVQLSVLVEEKPPKPISPMEKTMDQTIILPAGVADIQAQVDILVAQIKQLNKKSIDQEEAIELIAKQMAAKLDANDLKASPQNPEEFMNKLLKLAEHVIVLEKDVAKLKSQAPKAPIMPL